MRILLCEDYPSFAAIAEDEIADAGFRVGRTATNGHEAVYSVANEGPWDVVVTDYDLGFGPDGDEVAARALSEGVETVVLWSAVKRDYPGEVRTSSKADPRFHLLEKHETEALKTILRSAPSG